MRPVRPLGLMVVIGLVASVGLASGAAALVGPEFGRCVKVLPGKGKFADAGCTVKGASKEFSWRKGVKTKREFTIAGGEVVLAESATGEAKVRCTSYKSFGAFGTRGLYPLPARKISARKVVWPEIVLSGCETPSGKVCWGSPGVEGSGEVGINLLPGELAIIKKGATAKEDEIGLVLVGKESVGFEIVEFICGSSATGVGVRIQGSVILPVKTNEMLLEPVYTFKSAAGKQEPEKLEGGLPHILETRIGEGALEQTGLKQEATVTNEQEVEINSVV
jgi:hypothetical protein